MVEIIADIDQFVEFIKDTEAMGTITVDNEKVKSGVLFKDFVLDATAESVTVTATDTRLHKVIAQHLFKGAEVKKAGRIPVTNIQSLKKALSRLGRGDEAKMLMTYPDEDNKISVARIGTDRAYSFPTDGEGVITSLDNTKAINHFWKVDHVESFSTKTKKWLPWTDKLVVVPSDICEVAKDMKDFVKQKTVHVSVKKDKVLFKLGSATSRKGRRELMNVARKVLVGGIYGKVGDEEKFSGGKWEDPKDDAVEIEADYFHGFYAVLQQLNDDQAVSLHFINLLGGWMAWIHAENQYYELNYMVPFDSGKEEEKKTEPKKKEKGGKDEK